jgi:hypothetical protein
MPLIGRRPLLRAGMLGGAGRGIGGRREATARIDALTKLKGLRDSGILTAEQYESERRRLTVGI